MKKITLGIILGLSIALAFSFKTIYDLKTTAAEVNIYDGLAIFMDCEPTTAYQEIGEVRLAKISYKGDSYFEGRSTIIEKCKKTYPTAEGIILSTDKDYKTQYIGKVITFKK